jgi:hypothetical protein
MQTDFAWVYLLSLLPIESRTHPFPSLHATAWSFILEAKQITLVSSSPQTEVEPDHSVNMMATQVTSGFANMDTRIILWVPGQIGNGWLSGVRTSGVGMRKGFSQ